MGWLCDESSSNPLGMVDYENPTSRGYGNSPLSAPIKLRGACGDNIFRTHINFAIKNPPNLSWTSDRRRVFNINSCRMMFRKKYDIKLKIHDTTPRDAINPCDRCGGGGGRFVSRCSVWGPKATPRWGRWWYLKVTVCRHVKVLWHLRGNINSRGRES